MYSCAFCNVYIKTIGESWKLWNKFKLLCIQFINRIFFIKQKIVWKWNVGNDDYFIADHGLLSDKYWNSLENLAFWPQSIFLSWILCFCVNKIWLFIENCSIPVFDIHEKFPCNIFVEICIFEHVSIRIATLTYWSYATFALAINMYC